MGWYRRGTALISLVTIALGFAILFRAAFDGKLLGLLLGALFVAVGAARLYLLRRT